MSLPVLQPAESFICNFAMLFINHVHVYEDVEKGARLKQKKYIYIYKYIIWDALKRNQYTTCTCVLHWSSSISALLGHLGGAVGSVDVWCSARRSCRGRGF